LGGWTVTDAPLAIRLALSAELVPTTTLPKLRLAGDTANVPDAVPVPESAIVSGEFDAFDTTDKLPLAAPALAGVKVAVNVMLPPGVSVIGNPLNPLMENPAPLKFACEMETDDPPTLVSVSDKFTLLLTCTLPDARLVGFAVSVPCVTPVPDSAMLKLESDPLEVIVTLPLAAPLAVGANTTLNVVLCPAVSVTGSVSPFKLNPVPLADAAEIVRLDPPVLLSVSLSDFELPSCTLPNARLVGFAVSVPCVTPVPESAMLKLESDPLDVIVTLPLAAPLAVGANTTLNVVLCPAVSVKGNVSPLKLNPVPLADAAEIVRLDPPVLLSVSLNDFELPSCTLPNARLVGFAVSVPCVTPVPESAMLKLESDPLDVIVTLPLAAPLAVGANTTLNDVLWPAVSVKGSVSPLKLNPVPLADAAEIVRLDPPVLLSVSLSDFELPVCTLPNARLVGFALKIPGVTPFPANAMSTVVDDPLTVSDNLPLLEPAPGGVKFTLNVED